MGRVSNSERGLILVFDLDEAILFTTPEEYVDRKTGEVKKRQIKYYPDEYKERIGKSYKDYLEKYQMSMFEQLSDYEEEPAPQPTFEASNGYMNGGYGGSTHEF